MKKTVLVIFIIFLNAALTGCIIQKNEMPTVQQPGITSAPNTGTSSTTRQSSGTGVKTEAIVYENTQYGFRFSLPDSWKGYKIITDKWEGLAIGGSKVVETGPLISIRHPEWTSKNPRQDIPIMVFTLAQWDSLKQEKFHIGAAPVGPSELGRNSKYVFALPARYNYAFPAGYEEVENILNGKPLQPTENFASGAK